jgi:hypothetical protein
LAEGEELDSNLLSQDFALVKKFLSEIHQAALQWLALERIPIRWTDIRR